MIRFLLFPTNQHAVPLAISIRVQTNKTTRFTPLETKSIYNGKDSIQSKRNAKLSLFNGYNTLILLIY